MDIIDIKIMQAKHSLELAGEEWDRWGEIMQRKKESYVNLLKIKQCQTSDPEKYSEFVKQLERNEKATEEHFLDMDKPHYVRMMERMKKEDKRDERPE